MFLINDNGLWEKADDVALQMAVYKKSEEKETLKSISCTSFIQEEEGCPTFACHKLGC